jgi:phosphoribosylformylglycinamidine synthase subunit PurS
MKQAVLVFPGINRERDMARALKSLGVDGVASVRQGKVFDIELSGSDTAKAETALKDAADKLLANMVIENYRVEVLG